MIVSTGWKNLKTNSNNITLQEKKIYRVKVISMIPELVQQQVFVRGYKRKIDLTKNGRRNCLFDKEEKHAFNQVVLALRKRTTIKIIAKAFGMSTRTIWNIKSNVISDNHKFFPKVNVKRIVACLSKWIRAYRLGKIKQISIYKIMREIEPD
jgi:hypothetical protein